MENLPGLQSKKERSIAIVGAVASIAALYLYVRSKGAAAQAASGTPQDNSGLQGEIATLAQGLQDLKTKGLTGPKEARITFGYNNGTKLNFTNSADINSTTQHSTSGGGSGGFDLFGIFALFGGGSQTVNGQTTTHTVANSGLNADYAGTFNTTVDLLNYTDQDLASIEAFLVGEAGTYQQRIDAAKALTKGLKQFGASNPTGSTGTHAGTGST